VPANYWKEIVLSGNGIQSTNNRLVALIWLADQGFIKELPVNMSPEMLQAHELDGNPFFFFLQGQSPPSAMKLRITVQDCTLSVARLNFSEGLLSNVFDAYLAYCTNIQVPAVDLLLLSIELGYLEIAKRMTTKKQSWWNRYQPQAIQAFAPLQLEMLIRFYAVELSEHLSFLCNDAFYELVNSFEFAPTLQQLATEPAVQVLLRKNLRIEPKRYLTMV
jgi:hypothetical protein